ncbi:MAG: response regulator [Bacteroidota bacterium]
MKEINSIFIIDDDSITVFGIKKLLGSLDICEAIETYGNGKLAIDAIRDRIAKNEKLPDIIFLDINMPIMDGWQFLEEFIAQPITKKIRVNIITSSIDKLDLEKSEIYKSKTHHVVEYISKPIRKREIGEITKAA